MSILFQGENFVVRNFEPRDRDAVRKICCDTGFLGNPIDPVFQDRELFADFLCAYYTDAEPESSLILEAEGEVRGYILGSRHPDRQSRYNRTAMLPRVLKMLSRFATSYNGPSRRYILWLLTQGWRQVPHTPKGMAHFHINLLPQNRNVPQTKALIETFLDYLVRAGEPAVYGQMVTFHNRRGERMFARYGFELADSVEVTKYRRFVGHPIYLFTVIKDLKKNPKLYGTDLWRGKKEEVGGA
jgi:hypothetical protein